MSSRQNSGYGRTLKAGKHVYAKMGATLPKKRVFIKSIQGNEATIGWSNSHQQHVQATIDVKHLSNTPTSPAEEEQLTNNNNKLKDLFGKDYFGLTQVEEFMSDGATIDQAIKKYVDNVEGNYSELPPKLAAYAKEKGWLEGWEYPEKP